MVDKKSAFNIESDSFDIEQFSNLLSQSEEFQMLVESGKNLIPNFNAFVQDLFSSFYKHNVLFLPEDKSKPRLIISKTFASEGFQEPVLSGFETKNSA